MVTRLLLVSLSVWFSFLGSALYMLHAQMSTHDPPQSKPFGAKTRNEKAFRGGETLKQYHMVFSTSCSPFQDWQSIAFFYFAWKVKQTGTVTRIASGCTNKQVEQLRQMHKEQIEILSSNFKLYITPDFNFSGRTKYFNKPYGLRHWMENELGYPGGASEHDDDIIMLLDPDMMLLRPLTHTFYDYPSEIWWNNDFREIKWEVTHGWPMASIYAFGNSWQTSVNKFGNMTYVVGEGSPALKVSRKEAEQLYPAGPPYLATARDMYSIVQLWTVHVMRYYDCFSGFMSEMYAYSTAAAHLKLPHQLSIGFMLSNTENKLSEKWNFLNNVSRADSCEPKLPQNQLPAVFHYCQRYALGRWYFVKYQLRNSFVCTAPLLRVPPRDVGSRYDWYIFPNEDIKKKFTERNQLIDIIYNSYALCTMIDSWNEVATHYKNHHCKDDTGNYHKSFVFHTTQKFENFLAHPELEVIDS